MDRPGHTDDQIKINGISTLRKRAEKRGFPKVQLSWIIISYLTILIHLQLVFDGVINKLAQKHFIIFDICLCRVFKFPIIEEILISEF